MGLRSGRGRTLQEGSIQDVVQRVLVHRCGGSVCLLRLRLLSLQWTPRKELFLNKNRLCSKTCGIDKIVKKSKEKNYSEIQSELFIMTGNSSGLDPTPKRNHRAEVSRGILPDCHFLVDPTPKQIYSAEVRYSKRRHANCFPPPKQQPPQQQQQLTQF